MQNEDHSLYGYISRQPSNMIRGELKRLLLEEDCEINRQVIQNIIKVLEERGEDTHLDLSDPFPPRIPKEDANFFLS